MNGGSTGGAGIDVEWTSDGAVVGGINVGNEVPCICGLMLVNELLDVKFGGVGGRDGGCDASITADGGDMVVAYGLTKGGVIAARIDASWILEINGASS